MTREEAIFYIKELQKAHAPTDKKVAEAVDMAIEALSAEQGWIPCSERLPDVDVEVLASGYYNDVYIATLKEDKSEEYYWSAFGGFPVMFSAVDAWMPLPTSYKGGDDE